MREELPPENDYPAAHSMDCEWFAVDENGFVAIMSSGEDGPLPVEFELFRTREDYDGYQFLQDVEDFLGKKAEMNKFDIAMPASIGLYHYEHSFDEIADNEEESWETMTPYARVGVPEQPLHVSQLPEELAKKARLISFNSVSFPTFERLQPVGKPDLKCVFWGNDDYYKYYQDEQMQSQPLEPSMVASSGDLVYDMFTKSDQSQKPWWKRLFGL